MCIIDFIDKHEGFFMVLVTIVYVGATIGILFANKKSANAAEKQLKEAKNQLKESQDQFEESNRLACIPFLQIEKTRFERTDFEIVLPPSIEGNSVISRSPIESPKVIIKNVGNGSATNINYDFLYDDSNKETGIFPINAIMKGDQYCFLCVVPKEISEATWTLYYNDYIGNEYNQRINLKFMNNELISCENDMPRLVGE